MKEAKEGFHRECFYLKNSIFKSFIELKKKDKGALATKYNEKIKI